MLLLRGGSKRKQGSKMRELDEVTFSTILPARFARPAGGGARDSMIVFRSRVLCLL
jgi:hypothetical protein